MAAAKFKYNLESLEWDDAHRRNKEAVYCYCGLDYNDGDCMLRCSGCQQLFHWDCVACLKAKPLYGDSFYRFKCSVCTGGGSEEYKRDTLSWVQVIYVVLYHLIKTEPEKQYFRWRENICATISDNWEGLMPGKTKTATWHNTVAGCLSTHNTMFRSGFDDTQQPGNWTLKAVVEPALAKFKAPVKSKDSSSAAKQARRERATEPKRPKEKSADKPAIVEAGSEAEKEILEALGETQAGAKRSTKHRVSFSDDDSDDNGQSRKRGTKAKRRRADAKMLDNDADLLSSLQLYQILEMQHLGKTASSSTEKANTGGVDEEEVVEASGTVVCSPATAKAKGNELSSAIDSDLEDLQSLDMGDESEQDVVMASSPVSSPVRVKPLSPMAEPVVATPEPKPSITPASDDKCDKELCFAVEELEATKETGWTSLDGVVPQAIFDPSVQAGGTKSPTIMSDRAQWELRAQLSSSRAELTYAARRLYRRLELRKHKQTLGLPQFNIDEAVRFYMGRVQIPWPDREVDQRALEIVRPGGDGSAGLSDESGSGLTRSVDPGRVASDGADQLAPSLSVPVAKEAEPAVVIKTTAYANSFASRLLGRAVLRNSLTSPVPKIGPFFGRLLRPYIWRDWKSPYGEAGEQGAVVPDVKPETIEQDVVRKRPGLPMLQVHRAIRERKHAIFERLGLDSDKLLLRDERDSIDYVYFQSEHVRQVNELLQRTFWLGIDMSDALQIPEFSIVALYRRNVVGCAFLTPDAYLTYIAVSAGWEGAGIARFMIYHLAQTVPTKDVTLHVSATNLAMLFYQRLGFKPEKFAVDFYKHYLPASSRQSPNAFLMRLRRY
ncbi:hypothetical protein GGI20_002355 [Coemansia sp. BCRC 34301]|nr:hypothetical protein GGI20_002355 [Coemansia sp. BCRC 34301]